MCFSMFQHVSGAQQRRLTGQQDNTRISLLWTTFMLAGAEIASLDMLRNMSCSTGHFSPHVIQRFVRSTLAAMDIRSYC